MNEQNNSENRVLVVGGAGYIGGAVTDILTKQNIPFTVYDNLLYEHQYLKPVDFIYGDVRDTEKLAKVLPNYSAVIWLAAIVGDGACQVKPELTVAVNQDSVEWLANNYNGRIVFVSTCSVYGKNDAEVDEESTPNPLSLYAQTKIKCEEFLKNKNSFIVRLGTVYGLSDTYSRVRMDLAGNYMTANAVINGKLSVFGGSQWRPLVHVKNVGEVLVNGVKNPWKGVYNFATSNYQIKDLGAEIAKITGCKIEYVEQKFEDQRNYHASTAKAERDGVLKLQKVYTVEDGVKEIFDVISTKRVKYVENDVYFNARYIASLNEDGKLD
ncbi:MAG: NAD(P)-dependent oxidoreductase [Patescibacteria group bacterium]|nr:NAD(P)-dependent oxidoreductase [Patescibacteria group bacterium]